MMRDPRTPSIYYEDADARSEQMERLKGKLDDLLDALHALRNKRGITPATKKIVDDEMFKLEKKRYQKQSHEFALNAVDALASGDHKASVEKIKEAIDYKIFCRVEPGMIKGGEQIENHIFSDF